MLGDYEAEQHHLLALVEAAQRGGRSEREIVAIVEQYFGEPAARKLGIARERSAIRRLVRSAITRRAA